MTTPTAHQSVDLAITALDNSQILLTPQTGTPLASMMNVPGMFNWSFDHIAGLPEDERADALSQMVADETVEDLVPQVDNHNGEIIRNVAAAVVAHIGFAKNVVAPLVVEYQAVVQEVIETPDSFVSQFNVVIRELPEIMQDNSFRADVEKSAGGSALDPEKHVNIPCKGPEFVKEYLKTGSAGADKQIEAWAVSLGDEGLVKLWDFFYGNGSGSIASGAGGPDSVDTALYGFLTARRLIEDTPDGVALPLNEFRRYIGQYRDCAANLLRAAYIREDSLEKTKIVVSAYNQFTREIRVNGTTYAEYIKGGGKNEVIFGAMYAGASTSTIGDLVNNTDTYFQAFQRQEAMVDAQRRLKQHALVKGALKQAFLKLLADPVQEEVEAMNTFRMSSVEIGRNVEGQINCLSPEELKDISTACLKVMTRTRFPYTDAEQFLTSMDEAQKANPGLDAREVAHIATIELVADYVCAQINSTRIR